MIWSATLHHRLRAAVGRSAVLVALLALLLPALINGYPLIFHDTGAYLSRAFASVLEPGRGPVYGFFIAATGGRISLWPVIVVQALATLWLIAVTLRLHDLDQAWTLPVVVLALCCGSGAAWVTATVMPDAFTPLAVLAWYGLVFGGDRLSRRETVGMALLLLLAALVHITHLALLLGLSFCPGLFLLIRRPAVRRGLALATALPLLALPLLPLINQLASNQFAFTPGGNSFIFGRLVQSGLVERYLQEHCPDPAIRLCAYQGALPATGDSWLWDVDSPFRQLGGWDGYATESRAVMLGSLRDHPWLHLAAAGAAASEQLLRVGSGEDIDSPTWHTDAVIGRYLPAALPALLAARQHGGGLGAITDVLNRLYQPLTWTALLLLLLTLGWSGWQRQRRALPATIAIALAINAALCGIFSGPHDRYQSRLAWLALLAVVITLVQAINRRRCRSRPAPPPDSARR